MKKKNKWLNGVLPAILIHICIGSVYAWTLFVDPIAKELNTSQTKVQFAFSLAIFFLGMSAAFGGKLVESNIRRSGLLSTIFVFSGLLVTSLGVYTKSLILIYIGYGVIMGIGLGLGYLTPIKTLMIWFSDNKGFATGIAVCAFGFASTIASPLITYLINKVGLIFTFFVMGLIYFIPMLIASFIISKPHGFKEIKTKKDNFKRIKILKSSEFIMIWILFFLNIASGLALISTASSSLHIRNVNVSVVAAVVSIMGIFNGVGRIILAAISDKFKARTTMYKIITLTSFYFCIMAYFVEKPFMLIILLCLISACYGAGFSCLPSLLSDAYGMNDISKIHGMSLSAWGIAGLVGNNLGTLFYNYFNSYQELFVLLAGIYGIELLLTFKIKNKIYKLDKDI